jgi:predicted hydrocarbon binding protein
VAEGWLENLERWNWTLRDNPVCHDACGQIAAAFSVAFGKPADTYSVKETQCRSTGADACEFVVEVK